MNQSSKFRLVLPLSLLLGLSAAGCSNKPTEEPPLQGARIGGPFTLVDQNGRKVSEGDFAGRYRIVYFGYSHCPDVCPTDLQKIGEGLSQFEKSDPERAAKVQPIFITVDPERDNPASLKPWVAAFHPRLLGLSGTPQQIAAVTKAYGIFYQKQPVQPGGGYGVQHSQITYLMGPQGEPIALIPQDKDAAAIAGEIDRWVK
jgi:protein SCO1/2